MVVKVIVLIFIVDSLEFTMDEIIRATNHLDKSKELGRGGHGSVYIASNLRTYGTKAAIKILSKVSFMYR